ncbi:MAG TPA: co-chaperone GroES [Phycisphaerales bacterium]|nr:co-chaperone GroES [Phycisphaerales bacterium]
MKIRPMNGRVLVRPLETAEKTKGGIVIPDTAKEKPREGEVIAVAEDATEDVAIGDRVIYRQGGGTEIHVGEQENVFLETDDLLVKYVETDEIPE